MKSLTILLIGSLTFLATACSPVIYEAPHTSYGHPPHFIPVVVHDRPVYGYQNHIETELSDRHRRAAAYYRGEGGPGDLIEVSVRGGYLLHKGRRVSYSPATFRIAAGDIIRFPATGTGIDLFVRYEHGRLALDTDIFGGFAHTMVTINIDNPSDYRKPHKLHNDYIREAQVVVSPVAGKHPPKSLELTKNQPGQGVNVENDERSGSRQGKFPSQKKQDPTHKETSLVRDELGGRDKNAARQEPPATNNQKRQNDKQVVFQPEKPQPLQIARKDTAENDGRRVQWKNLLSGDSEARLKAVEQEKDKREKDHGRQLVEKANNIKRQKTTNIEKDNREVNSEDASVEEDPRQKSFALKFAK